MDYLLVLTAAIMFPPDPKVVLEDFNEVRVRYVCEVVGQLKFVGCDLAGECACLELSPTLESVAREGERYRIRVVMP